jgi:peptidoglycan/LPS O-acetylase OafA/YrhL
MSVRVSPAVPVREVSDDVRPAPRRFSYQPSLDGLRAIAIVLVMLLHAQAMAGGAFPYFFGGYTGVDVFFVLSGFLITSLLLQEWGDTGRISLRKFYMRRALRLFPALVVLLLVLGIGVKVFGLYLHVTAATMLSSLFYVANWVVAYDAFDMGALHHTWSLSVEEQFYILWPLILIGMLRVGLKPRVILAAIGSIIAFVFLERLLLWEGVVLSKDRFGHGLDTRADSLLIGCALAVLLYYRMLPSNARAITIYRSLGVLGAAFLVYWNVWTPSHAAFLYYGGCTAIAVASSFVVLALQFPVAAPIRLVLESPFLVWIGRLSYSLYIWHYPMFILAKQFADWPSVLAVQFGLSVVTASVSYYLVEQPALRFKKRFEVK